MKGFVSHVELTPDSYRNETQETHKEEDQADDVSAASNNRNTEQ